ncbi:hypothetical protein [Francisella philomiragia]|uniref:Uncharacterized protein n=1 Tax=Francisella philomiragia TaxID=28110 RepID=A0ABS1GD98_9GAMM|nr:hypothetical protein [Francisella philomiragia]MBK2259188.1 hypothetical protein [Francisella philomiragia]MBK2302775.1 hypothetical protein [Francisella philomiragia]
MQTTAYTVHIYAIINITYGNICIQYAYYMQAFAYQQSYIYQYFEGVFRVLYAKYAGFKICKFYSHEYSPVS